MSADPSVELVIEARRRDLGGFEVGRVLPWTKRRMVGPFVFFDHMGPVQTRCESAAARRRAAASAHRPVDDHVSVRGRDRASGQPRLSPGDSSRRGELDDCGPRHLALRALRDDARARRVLARHPGVDCAAGERRRDRTEFVHYDAEALPLERSGGASSASSRAKRSARRARCKRSRRSSTCTSS